MKAKDYGKQIAVAYAHAVMTGDKSDYTNKVAEVMTNVAFNEVRELIALRNVKTDDGLISIYRQQRQRWATACKWANKIDRDVIAVEMFDKLIAESHPDIYPWYRLNVVEQPRSAER